jgi:hypothetical protein
VCRNHTLIAAAVSGALVVIFYGAAAGVTSGWCGSRRAVWNSALLVSIAVDAVVAQPLFVLGVAAARYVLSDNSGAAVRFTQRHVASAGCLSALDRVALLASPHPPYPAHGAWIADEALLPPAMVPVDMRAATHAARSRATAESGRTAQVQQPQPMAMVSSEWAASLTAPPGEDAGCPSVPRPMSPGVGSMR